MLELPTSRAMLATARRSCFLGDFFISTPCSFALYVDSQACDGRSRRVLEQRRPEAARPRRTRHRLQRRQRVHHSAHPAARQSRSAQSGRVHDPGPSHQDLRRRRRYDSVQITRLPKVIREEAASPLFVADPLLAVANSRSTVFARWRQCTRPCNKRPANPIRHLSRVSRFSTVHIRYQRTYRRTDWPTDRTGTEFGSKTRQLTGLSINSTRAVSS